MRHKISIPGYLREANEEDFLRDLQRARPAAIVIVKRPAGEYGRGLFGQGYGQRTRDWIERHYFRRQVPAAPRKSLRSSRDILNRDRDE